MLTAAELDAIAAHLPTDPHDWTPADLEYAKALIRAKRAEQVAAYARWRERMTK